MTFSLRQELEKVSEEDGLNEVEEAMYANHEVECAIGGLFNSKINCDFKITRKEMEEQFNDDVEQVSQAIWTHRYDHCRTYKR